MKKFIHILAIVTLMLTGCKKDEPLPIELTLTSPSTIELSSEATTESITVRITNPRSGAQLAATTDATWVHSFVVSDNSRITFQVDANESSDARSTRITVSYGDKNVYATVNQSAASGNDEPDDPDTPAESEDIEFTATHLTGLYNGYYMGYYTNPNYFFYLGNGEVSDLQSDAPLAAPNGKFYVIDLFVENAPTEEPITIPEGTYTFDSSGENRAGTFTSYSRYFTTGALPGQETTSVDFVDGTLTVTAEGMTLQVTDTDGIKHTVTFAGSYLLVNNSGSDIGDDTPIEEIEEHAAPNCFIRYTDNGIFYFTLGPNDYFTDAQLIPDARYYIFSLHTDVTEVSGDAREALPKGTYTIDLTDSAEPWTIDGTDRSMYVKNNSMGYTVDADYFSEGTLTVTDEGVIALVKTSNGNKWHKVTYSFVEQSHVTAYYYGGDYDNEDNFPGAVTDYEILMDFSESGYKIMLGMLSDQDTGAKALPTGKFDVEFPVAGQPFSGTVIRGGEIFMDYYIFPSYITLVDPATGSSIKQAIITDGSVTISHLGADCYKFEVDVIYDDQGTETQKSFEWSCAPTFEDRAY